MKFRRRFEQLRQLRELQRLGMTVAEDLHACAKAEKDPKKLIELTDAFLLVGEEVRQAIVLESKLARDMKAALPESREEAGRQRRSALDPGLAAEPPTKPTRR